MGDIKMCIGSVESVEVSEFYPKGRKMRCSQCLYGNRNYCPAGITKLCNEHLGWLPDWRYKFTREIREYKLNHDRTLLFEIIDNEDYFDRDVDENGDEARWYVHCEVCGYIPTDEAGADVCIHTEHLVSYNYCFSELEILKIKDDRREAKYMEYVFDAAW